MENDAQHGQGEYVWSDGRKYDGTWVNNMMHGEGELRYEDDRFFKGIF